MDGNFYHLGSVLKKFDMKVLIGKLGGWLDCFEVHISMTRGLFEFIYLFGICLILYESEIEKGLRVRPIG